MTSNYYTLALVAADLDTRLRGKAIAGAFTQEKNEMVLTFHRVTEVLIISCLAGTNTLYLHPSFSRSRKNSTDVLRDIAGKTILSVMIQPADRVISFGLSDNLTIHACFFGSKANVVLIDKESRIADAFKESRAIIGGIFSPSQDKILHDIAALRSLVSQQPDEKILSILKQSSPALGSTLAREILFRSNLSDVSYGKDVTGQLDLIERDLAAVLGELSRPSPRVYICRDGRRVVYRFSLVKLEHCHECEERRFPDVHEAIRFFLSRTRSAFALESRSKGVLDALQERRLRLQRTLKAVEGDLEGTSRAEEYERFAHLLMANLNALPEGVTSFNLNESGPSRVTVPLDPKLSPAQNAQRYFEKARKSKAAYHESRTRLVETRGSLLLVENLIIAASAIQRPEDLTRFLADHAEELEKAGLGEKAEKRERLPFRIFTVDGGYEVWAGKNGPNNDELTMKYTKPNDLWFHARGGSGSHVVLKAGTGKGEVSKKAKEQAAGIAAYYSKMRNAKVVPVAMTERKYVRKPKGVSPGTVILERENVVFAEPALPRQGLTIVNNALGHSS